MSARPFHTAAALLAALCLLLTPSLADAGVRHHRAPGAKKAQKRIATFKAGRNAGKANRGKANGRDKNKGSGNAVTPSNGSSAQASVADGPGPAFGAFTDGAPYDGNVDSIDALQKGLGRNIDIVNWYQSWGGGKWVEQVQPEVIAAVTNSGRTPTLTWEPWDPAQGSDQPAFRLRKIVDGEFDAYIAGWADGLRDVGKDIYLRPMHEMNGNWYPWGQGKGDNTPALYIQAWRHMHDIFRDHGASNVKFVWSVCNYSVPNTGANAIEKYYPGDDYVDVMGIDGYNWGSTKPEYGGWMTFSEVFKQAYDRLAKLGPQPIWINEVGSAPEGGSKAEWVRDMFATAKTWPRLKAIVWFDQNKEEDWRAMPVASAFAS